MLFVGCASRTELKTGAWAHPTFQFLSCDNPLDLLSSDPDLSPGSIFFVVPQEDSQDY